MHTLLRLAFSLVLIVMLNGCAKKTMVALVPDPDGKTGRITVANQAGSTAIESPYDVAIISDKNKQSPPVHMGKEAIESIFSDALSIQPKRPIHFILYFEKDTVLTSDSIKLMTDILTAIKEQGATNISIVGHADTVGSKELNFTLSKNRADSIRDLLVEKGINLSYINTTSHGKENPLIKTEDNVNEPRNRRVEVVIR
jgi:outer membrane protein OmpA-like peptidoglycan-associated protein